MKIKKLVLLNSEGAVLTAYKSLRNPGVFTIQDQHKKIVDIIDRMDFHQFINGNYTITDSNAKTWNYPIQDNGMKADPTQLLNFINE